MTKAVVFTFLLFFTTIQSQDVANRLSVDAAQQTLTTDGAKDAETQEDHQRGYDSNSLVYEGDDPDVILEENKDPEEDPQDTSVDTQRAERDAYSNEEKAIRSSLDPEASPSEPSDPVIRSLSNWNFWWKCLRRGMTWKTVKPFCSSHGTGKVGCAGCDPYNGDTICWYKRPILCINPQQIQRPDYDVVNTFPWPFYNGWSGAFLKKTEPIRGCYIFSRWHADWICKKRFGSCWRMAEFHDGFWRHPWAENADSFCQWNWSDAYRGGWNFHAFGDKNATLNYGRFWVAINDQPANCWN